MRPKWDWMVVILVLLNGGCYCCCGCLEQERTALLEIKAWINHPNGSALEFWVKSLDADCCEWMGVTCRTTKGQVTKISLGDLRAYWDWGYLYMNASLFAPFKELKSLDLSVSNLHGSLACEGWSELKNLEELDLSYNELDGVLPPCLSNLSSLQVMDLSYNHFGGNIASSPLVDLISLEYLAFPGNNFQVPNSFASFSNHSNLKFIWGDDNEVTPESAVEMSTPKFQLKFFSMSNCSSKTRKAEYPNFLFYQNDLKFLDLSYNNFSGLFPSWLVENNTGIQTLIMRDNSLVGTPKLHYPAHNLSSIDIASNKLGGTLRTICSIFPNLEHLIMPDNGVVGTIPPCFQNMSRLQYLDLSNNRLSSGKQELLPLFGISLWFLKLSNNSFEGKISAEFFNSSTPLCYVYLDNNHFFGHIPDSASIEYPLLHFFDISNNHFSGMLPRWLGNISSDIDAIDFSKNQFEGSIPEEFCNLLNLDYLTLSENSLSGSIPSCFNSSQSISHVHLHNNKLSGPWTYAFRNNSYLVTLDLRENGLSGPIPEWIGSLPSLSILLLKQNKFDGPLPPQLCLLKELSILDLSNNEFSGPLPLCLSNLNFSTIEPKSFDVFSYAVFLQSFEPIIHDIDKLPLARLLHRKYKWPALIVKEGIEFTTKRLFSTYKGTILDYMSGIDLSCNKFSGEIPAGIGNITALRALNLSHNKLTGTIPATLSNLGQIESLDLSHNNLNGGIPQQLVELHFLSVFSVAYNNLSGKTPEWKNQFGTFDASSYEGNPLLSGPPLTNESIEIEPQSQPIPDGTVNECREDSFLDMQDFFVSFGVSYTMVVVTIAAVLYINLYWRRLWFYFIEELITGCYYFVLDSFRMFSC
ncbi:hypothetical protein Tsubulata_019890 [Turnera subulata]|uniref:Leucine-rich repeat-containing N-terminal plant-type domain-containing protein n=1 Tax=Turnera subulata TaxID=218843 RepID=A0A9Q0GAW5_9ROSI|nr:hypothetical protein Tsubulata_019890 [Turnera subulata]